MQETLFGTFENPAPAEPETVEIERIPSEAELRNIGQYTLFTYEVAEVA